MVGQPACQALVSADYMSHCCSRRIYLPMDILQYYQSLALHSVCAEEKIGGAQPVFTSSGLDQPPWQATTTAFQVGQGHKGDCCHIVMGTENMSVVKKRML